MKNNDASSLLPKQPELFTPDGHLTDQAFSLLLSEQLDQLQSLVVSEHHSFCDKCLDRYTSLLCGEISLDSDKSIELSPEEPILSQPAADHLIEPPPQLPPSVMKQLAHRSRVFYLHKFTSLAVAASLALVFWTGGIFSNGRLSGAVNNLVNDLHASSQTILEHTGNISQGVNAFFNSIQNQLLEWNFSSFAPKR